MDDTTTAQAGDTAETFSFFNPQTKSTVNLPNKIGDVETRPFLESIIAKSNEDFRKKYKGEIDTLNQKLTTFDTMQARLDELESLSLPAKEREAKEFQKQLEKERMAAKTAQEKLSSFENAFKNEKLTNAVMQEASKFSDTLHSLDDAVTLFRAQCSPALVQDGEAFRTVATLDGQEMSVSDAWAKWMNSPSKTHLLKNQLASGAGSTGGARQTPGATPVMKKASFDAMNATEKMAFINKGGDLID